MTVMPSGWIAPAPRPCSARQTTSAGIDQASPQNSEAAVNTAMPVMSSGLRPTTSASLP